MLICLLWVVCVSTAYGQHTEDASVDTLKQSSREQQMQARLENYVQLLSTRKKPERPRVMVMPDGVPYFPDVVRFDGCCNETHGRIYKSEI